MDKRNLEKIFIEHLENHQNIIFKIARIYAPTPDEKDDLVQEILYQAWRSFKDFRMESKFSTWLYRVALNTALTAIRFYKKRKLEIHNEDSTLDFSGPVYQPETPDSNDNRIYHRFILVRNQPDRLVRIGIQAGFTVFIKPRPSGRGLCRKLKMGLSPKTIVYWAQAQLLLSCFYPRPEGHG